MSYTNAVDAGMACRDRIMRQIQKPVNECMRNNSLHGYVDLGVSEEEAVSVSGNCTAGVKMRKENFGHSTLVIWERMSSHWEIG